MAHLAQPISSKRRLDSQTSTHFRSADKGSLVLGTIDAALPVSLDSADGSKVVVRYRRRRLAVVRQSWRTSTGTGPGNVTHLYERESKIQGWGRCYGWRERDSDLHSENMVLRSSHQPPPRVTQGCRRL